MLSTEHIADLKRGTSTKGLSQRWQGGVLVKLSKGILHAPLQAGLAHRFFLPTLHSSQSCVRTISSRSRQEPRPSGARLTHFPDQQIRWLIYSVRPRASSRPLQRASLQSVININLISPLSSACKPCIFPSSANCASIHCCTLAWKVSAPVCWL